MEPVNEKRCRCLFVVERVRLLVSFLFVLPIASGKERCLKVDV